MNKKFAITIIISLGIAVFFNGFFNGAVGDDIPQIVENTALGRLKNIPYFFTGSTFFNGSSQSLSGVYYKPLLITYFSLIKTLSGSNFWLFHVLQTGLHITSTILLFLFLSKFLHQKTALFLSLVFLVHPINSEAVLYISDAQDLLFFGLGMGALLMWTSAKPGRVWLSGGLLLAALLSKETGVLFLPMLIFYSLLFEKKRLKSAAAWSTGVWVMYLGLRIRALGGILAKSLPIAPIEKASLGVRLLNGPEILFYFIKTFWWPINLSYSYNWLRTSFSWRHVVGPAAGVVVFAAGIIYFGRQIYLKKSSFFKWYIFWGAWLSCGLLMHLQIIPLDVTVAERWFYFPTAGLLAMLGILAETYQLNLKPKKAGIWLVVAVIGLLSTRTFVRSFDFRNEITLDSHDIKVSTDDYNLENGLASDLLKNGLTETALEHAKKSIELNPFWSNYNTLGSIYLAMGNYEDAKTAYLKSASFLDYYQVYENLAGLTLVGGSYFDNAKDLETYLIKYPQSAKLWMYLAIIHYENGNLAEADRAIGQAVRYNTSANPEVNSIYQTIHSRQPLRLNLVVGTKSIR